MAVSYFFIFQFWSTYYTTKHHYTALNVHFYFQFQTANITLYGFQELLKTFKNKFLNLLKPSGNVTYDQI
jgi:hypothetical protein